MYIICNWVEDRGAFLSAPFAQRYRAISKQLCGPDYTKCGEKKNYKLVCMALFMRADQTVDWHTAWPSLWGGAGREGISDRQLVVPNV